MMEGPWCRFRREARAREQHRHCSGGYSENCLTSNGRLEKWTSRHRHLKSATGQNRTFPICYTERLERKTCLTVGQPNALGVIAMNILYLPRRSAFSSL